jgi:hypothetical protein
MEAVCSSDIWVLHYQTTRRYNPCRENFGSCVRSVALDFYYRHFILQPSLEQPRQRGAGLSSLLINNPKTTPEGYAFHAMLQRHHEKDDSPRRKLPTGNNFTAAGFEVLTAVVMKSSTISSEI